MLYPFCMWVDAGIWGYVSGWTSFWILQRGFFSLISPNMTWFGGKCPSLISHSKQFSIWRSLRTQYIKLSCSNWCLLQFILSCQPSDRMWKVFFLFPSAFSICKDLICCPCFPGVGVQGEGVSHDPNEDYRPDICRHQLSSLLKLGMGFCPAVSLPGA